MKSTTKVRSTETGYNVPWKCHEPHDRIH